MASNMIEEFIVGLGFRFEGEDGERYKKQTERISSSLNALSAAAAAALTALFALSKQQGAMAANNDRIATSIDTSAEAMGKWQFAAKKVGVDGNAVVGMLQGLKQASQEAVRSGTGPFRAFQELDVDWQGIASGAVDVSDALDGIIEKAQTLDRASAQSGLRELGIDVKFLDTPITKLRAYQQEFVKFGKVSDDLTKKGKEFQDAWDGAGVRLEGASNMLAQRALPTFTKFFIVLEDGLEWVQDEGFPIMDEFIDRMGGWDKVIGGLAIVAIPALIGTLGLLAKILGGVTGGFAGAAGAAGKFARGGLLAGAAAGGYLGGKALQSGHEEFADQVGDFLVNALGLIGLEEGTDFTRTRAGKNDPNRPGYSGRQDGWSPSTTYLNNQAMQAEYAAAKLAHPEDYPDSNPNALRDAMIGRESAGDTNAVSGKGARGLMQLMPGTAEETARELGLPYDKDRLTSDPEYNKTLGTAYLQKMLDKYTGSEGLAVAAYNAGPGSVDNWLEQNGDPRNGGISMADWIKKIPYKETRDYTQNVLNDKAGILPPTYDPQGGLAASGSSTANKTINNTFNGLRQAEIESIMRQAEEEQNTLMGNEAKDAIVR
jgi:Soluble lytic murein transglycosylase and related regulatory proteins (some contain LysM/invasin domains)